MKKIFFSVILLLSFTASVLSQDVIKWSFSMENGQNGEVNLVAKASVEKGWHMYDSNIPDGGPTPTQINFDKLVGATPVGKFQAVDRKPHVAFDDVFQMKIGTFDGQVKFVQRLKITDKAKFSAAGDVRAQGCNDNTCTPPLPTEFSFSASNLPAGVVEDKKAAAAVDSTATVATTDSAVIAPVVASAPVNSDVLWEPVTEELKAMGTENTLGGGSLWNIFLKGLIWGFAALLTPCVWPMIPITVSFFLNRNKKSRSKALKDAVVYGASIIVIYVALGLIVSTLFGASALNSFATSAAFNLVFFVLLIVFAISFFGAFEMVLPASWTNKMDSKVDSTTGWISLFFMAFTLALVSFSCTGPIIGWLLVDAATQGNYLAPAVGMFAFAFALSIPFVLFALFPSWLKTLPKSGGWLNSVKVVLGFIVLAVSLKFLSIADLSNGWGILDRDVFLVIWIVIFGMMGLYLLGKIKFHHDSDLPYLGVGRLFMAMAAFAIAIYLLPGIWGAPLKPISSILPPMSTQDFKPKEDAFSNKFMDYEAGMAYAAQTGKPVLLDFAGYGCVNCHKMEATVLANDRVKKNINDNFVLITLMVDEKAKLPQPMEVTENGKTMKLKTVGDKWSYLQRHKFGTQSQPFYIVLNHQGKPISKGYNFDDNINNFLNFLDSGKRNFK